MIEVHSKNLRTKFLGVCEICGKNIKSYPATMTSPADEDYHVCVKDLKYRYNRYYCENCIPKAIKEDIKTILHQYNFEFKEIELTLKVDGQEILNYMEDKNE